MFKAGLIFMKKAVVLLLSVISSLAYSQQILYPVAHKLENTRYIGSPLSLEGYLQKNKEKCTNRVATQILKLAQAKNKDFVNYSTAIGAKLKQADDRCNYFRFELIDYVEDGGIDMRFAYRCYATKSGTLPHQRVSHIDPLVINPSVFYKDEDLIEEKCDALAIMKKLNASPAKSMKNSSSSTSVPAAAPVKTNVPSNNRSKKVSTQN